MRTQRLLSRDVGPLSEYEARQFLRHAARVRSLHLSPSCDRHVHLLDVLIGTNVFPKLLVLECGELSDTKFLRLFLSPTLRQCVLPVSHSNLKSIGTHCPVLESLSITNPDFYTPDEVSLLSHTVRSCKRLVNLHCHQLDSAAWEYLAGLPTLLTLNILVHEAYPLAWDPLYFACFLNITTLVFDVHTGADVVTILQHSEFPSLKEFEMDVFLLLWNMAEQLLSALSKCKAFETLECIRISSDPEFCDAELSDVPLTVLRYFFPFSLLKTLRLRIHHRIYLDNNLLLEAMSSWPHIRNLELMDRRDLDYRPLYLVTFRGLFAALRMCPHLNTLQISMDARKIDIDVEAEPFQHASLQNFIVCDSYIQDPYTVARIIFSMFPSINVIYHYSNNPDPWNTVNDFLGDFRVPWRKVEDGEHLMGLQEALNSI